VDTRLLQFSFREWEKMFGINFTPEERNTVGEFPWSEEILRESYPWVVGRRIEKRTVAETHLAFVGRHRVKAGPLTMMRLYKMFPPNPKFPGLDVPSFQMWPIEDHLKTNRFSAIQVPKLRWYLMPIQVSPCTLRKNYENGKATFSENYEVPYAIEEILKNFLLWHVVPDKAYHNRRALCRDLVSGGDRAAVGPFTDDGLWVGGIWDNPPRHDTGIAASRILGR